MKYNLNKSIATDNKLKHKIIIIHYYFISFKAESATVSLFGVITMK